MIENPSTPITLPKEVADHVAKVRESLAIQEIELKNIRKARASEEASISSMIKQKEELTISIASLEDKRKEVEETLKIVEEKVSKSSQENHALSIILAELELKVAKQREEDAKGFQALTIEKDAFRIEQEKLADRERECAVRENRANDISEAITKAITAYVN